MCRAHERHCPCTPEQREDHNRRRRENRRLRTGIADWAEALGEDPAVVEQLRHGNVSDARAWAEQRAGVDAAVLARTHASHPQSWPGIPSSTPQDRYTPPDAETPAVELVRQIAAATTTPPISRQEQRLAAATDVRAVGDLYDVPDPGVNETFEAAITYGDGEVGTGWAKPLAGANMEIAADFGHEAELGPLHEVAASRLASALGGRWAGLVPATVMRKVGGRLGSLAQDAPGGPGIGKALTDIDGAHEAGFLDAVMAQQDRHEGNLLIAADRITLIDHGFAFARRGDMLNANELNSFRVASHPQLTDDERGALARLRASPDLLGVAPLLDTGRAEAMRERVSEMLRSGEVLHLVNYLE